MSTGLNLSIELFLFITVAYSCAGNNEHRKESGKASGNFTSHPAMIPADNFSREYGAITRGDTASKSLALVFTGDEFGDGGDHILEVLRSNGINASFFLTGNYYRNTRFEEVIRKLKENGNYLGSHSDRHLLYCDWVKRDSLYVSKKEFLDDLEKSYAELKRFGVGLQDARYFLPPYEWYNDSIAVWTEQAGLILVNFTGGTSSNADYTTPSMGNRYVDSKTIYNSILDYETSASSGLNGFILLIHIGTDPGRTDKFYYLLPDLITYLKGLGYRFVRIDDLLG